MPIEKSEKRHCVDDLRHAEYYNLQPTFDDLYEKSKNGEVFDNLMEIILSEENIMLAYRNIKSNKGSNTPGTDKLTIQEIGRLSKEEVVQKVRYFTTGSKHGYRPKPVRRRDIPKPNGTTRPLGIPCIWDRQIQQSCTCTGTCARAHSRSKGRNDYKIFRYFATNRLSD